jgi:predicted nucleic acid-binding protein
VSDLGWIDTAILIHALRSNDPFAARCRVILQNLRDGTDHGWLDPLVIHEASYVILRLGIMPDLATARGYLRAVIDGPGVHMQDKDTMRAALDLWGTGGRSLVDALLTVQARQGRSAVCTPNVKHFPGLRSTF